MGIRGSGPWEIMESAAILCAITPNHSAVIGCDVAGFPLDLRILEKIWEFIALNWVRGADTRYCMVNFSLHSLGCLCRLSSSEWVSFSRHYRCFWPLVVKFAVASHEIPWHPFLIGSEVQRGIKTSRRKDQVSYRHPLYDKRSGARASRHPPRWRAQLDNPRDGTRAADRACGSSPIRRFPFGPPAGG